MTSPTKTPTKRDGTPRRKGDWVGRYVVLRRDFETRVGTRFFVGEVMRVHRSFNGLHLEATENCDRCGRSSRQGIIHIPEADVRLLPLDYDPELEEPRLLHLWWLRSRNRGEVVATGVVRARDREVPGMIRRELLQRGLAQGPRDDVLQGVEVQRLTDTRKGVLAVEYACGWDVRDLGTSDEEEEEDGNPHPEG